MREVQIHRPITIPNLAKVLGIEPYRLMAELIKRAVFPAPRDAIDDVLAIELAASMNIQLKIIDDEDGGCQPLPIPTKPTPPIATSDQLHPK
jgi:hypothetical protein